jgi:hypothetical protein
MKRTVAYTVSLALLLTGPPPPTFAAQRGAPNTELAQLVKSIAVNGKAIDTKTYLKQAWELKGRAGLMNNGRMDWDPRVRQWHVRPVPPVDFSRAIAHYGSFTAPAGSMAVAISETYDDAELADELAQFYTAFLHAYFTTLGELRKTSSPDIKARLLGPETGPDSTRTLAWWADSPAGVTLRECYLCNEEYFVPVAALIEVVAKFKPGERTAGMKKFVAEYVPLVINDHILRPNFAQEMRDQMGPRAASLKRRNMSEEEIGVVTAAALVLGADAADARLVALTVEQRANLKDLVNIGVSRFQFSRTLTKDSEGRTCATYFNGDYDWLEDFQYADYEGERLPTPADKSKVKGKSWDTSHFNVVPMFLRALHDNRAATGVNFPQTTDIEYIANQYAYHVFEGDFKRPLFRNYMDGSDGWYRVGYLGRNGYGVAPSRYCNQFDKSRSCLTTGDIMSWGLLAPFHSGLAKIELAIVDLARSYDPTIACFQPACFRERYYWHDNFSFSFVDAQGSLQYPPALVLFLSQLTWASFTAP